MFFSRNVHTFGKSRAAPFICGCSFSAWRLPRSMCSDGVGTQDIHPSLEISPSYLLSIGIHASSHFARPQICRHPESAGAHGKTANMMHSIAAPNLSGGCPQSVSETFRETLSQAMQARPPASVEHPHGGQGSVDPHPTSAPC